MKRLALVLFILAGCGPSDGIPREHARPAPAVQGGRAPSKTEQAALRFGCKTARDIGGAMFRCSDGDSWINSATVACENQLGVVVEAYVCCGWIKGCTVRF